MVVKAQIVQDTHVSHSVPFLSPAYCHSHKGNKMLFSLILCDSSLAPVVGFIFSQHLICPWPLHWQNCRGKGISEREVHLMSVLCCSLLLHRGHSGIALFVAGT